MVSHFITQHHFPHSRCLSELVAYNVHDLDLDMVADTKTEIDSVISGNIARIERYCKLSHQMNSSITP